MNKLILIGNGFDKAHGLPTSYTDFINDFWSNLEDNYLEDDIKKLVFINKRYCGIFDYDEGINCFIDFNKSLFDYSNSNGNNFNYDGKNFTLKCNEGLIFEFKNNFFKQLNKKQALQNWVDIENEYYYQLKEIVKIINQNNETKRTLVKELNEEFEQVKKLLEKYLKEKILDIYDFNVSIIDGWYSFFEILKPISISENSNNILDEFTREEDKKHIKYIFEKKNKGVFLGKSYVLNFNYTQTLNSYFQFRAEKKLVVNQIHGYINNDENPINFGYGDEMDEDYKLIENLNDKEYLENFKSFQYLQNSDYNKLLSYIDSGKFQIYIMGHSCGLSDRTLLNTIFEHDNCCSIKVFYHERKNDDNYTEIIQNISRHFDDKQKMRSKVVNKTLCQPMPQIQLAKKIR